MAIAVSILSLVLSAARQIFVFRPTFSRVACIPLKVAASQVIGQTLVLNDRKLTTNEIVIIE